MAYDYEPDLDGNMTISETESACEYEQDAGFELVVIHYGTKTVNGQVFLVNKTGFNRKLTAILKNLHFVEIKDSDNLAKVRTDKEGLGWTFICKSEIYEKNLTKKVMVFGKLN